MKPSVHPLSPSQLDADIEAVLHDGVLAGHLPGVRAIRSSLEVSRQLAQLGVVAGDRDPATPSEPLADRIPRPRQARPRFEKDRCGHTHPEKGPCVREPHPGTPRAHDYNRVVVSRRAPETFDVAAG